MSRLRPPLSEKGQAGGARRGILRNGLLLATLLVAGASSGEDLGARLAGSAVELPLAEVLAAVGEIEVLRHGRDDWRLAFYLPPETSLDPELLAEVGLAGEGVAEEEAPPPRPRLVLYAPAFAGDWEELPVDVAEYLFHALLEAHFDRLERSPYLDAARERASVLYPDLEPAAGLAAYLGAGSEFGAHVLSIAHEVERAARRARARGGDLCGLLQPPRGLFALWQRSFAAGVYRPEDVAGPPRCALERADKDLFVVEVFGTFWSGDPARDFAWICPRGE